MALMLGGLRHPPAVFWAMTMPELLSAVAGALGRTGPPAATPDAAALRALMQRFPD